MGTLNILLVENHRIVAEQIRAFLVAQGHNVVSATDYRSAVRAILAHPVDLLLSDLRLPDGDGRELSRLTRTTHPGAVTIAMSAAANVNIGTIKAGYDHFLAKPFIPSDLEEIISKKQESRD